MTPKEFNMYGISVSDIEEQYCNSLTAKISGKGMVIGSILSDCQEMLHFGSDSELIRKQLNIAKYILFQVMDENGSLSGNMRKVEKEVKHY